MEATMQIEVPKIDVDVATVTDVPAGQAANYTLRMMNESQTSEDVYYKLMMIDETNPDYYQIWLLPAEGVTTLEAAASVEGSVKVMVSPLSLNARTRYFHDEKSAGREMSITYRGQEFNNSDTSYKGYVRCAMLGKKIALEFGEEKIGLEGYYAGKYIEIK